MKDDMFASLFFAGLLLPVTYAFAYIFTPKIIFGFAPNIVLIVGVLAISFVFYKVLDMNDGRLAGLSAFAFPSFIVLSVVFYSLGSMVGISVSILCLMLSIIFSGLLIGYASANK